MKQRRHLVIAALVAIPALEAAAAEPAGFAPWAEARITDTPDAVQADVPVMPWGVSAAQWPTAGAGDEQPDARQARIDIRPWYARGAI